MLVTKFVTVDLANEKGAVALDCVPLLFTLGLLSSFLPASLWACLKAFWKSLAVSGNLKRTKNFSKCNDSSAKSLAAHIKPFVSFLGTVNTNSAVMA